MAKRPGEEKQGDLFLWHDEMRMKNLIESREFQQKIKDNELHFRRHQTLLPHDHPDSLHQLAKKKAH